MADGDPDVGTTVAPSGFRARLARRPVLLQAWRVLVAVVGLVVLALGIVAIPYPGPGWLIVFTGLAILASEFAWAQRILRFARGKYDAWTAWLRRQSLPVRALVLSATGLVVVTTLWVVGAFGVVVSWVGLEGWTWLQSPLVG